MSEFTGRSRNPELGSTSWGRRNLILQFVALKPAHKFIIGITVYWDIANQLPNKVLSVESAFASAFVDSHSTNLCLYIFTRDNLTFSTVFGCRKFQDADFRRPLPICDLFLCRCSESRPLSRVHVEAVLWSLRCKACHQALDSSLPDAADTGSKDVRIAKERLHCKEYLRPLVIQRYGDVSPTIRHSAIGDEKTRPTGAWAGLKGRKSVYCFFTGGGFHLPVSASDFGP